MLNFQQNIQLENHRCLLRPLTLSDEQNLLPFSLNEPEIWKYSLVGANGRENLKAYLMAAEQGRNSGREYAFIVFDKKFGLYAGSSRWYDIQAEHLTLKLGYTWYGKNFQGSGLNQHCKYLMLAYVFEKMNFARVEFRADARNERSIAAMKSIGCTVEGILRSDSKCSDGSRRDSIVLSILNSEWKDHVKDHLMRKCNAV